MCSRGCLSVDCECSCAERMAGGIGMITGNPGVSDVQNYKSLIRMLIVKSECDLLFRIWRL